MDNGNRIVLDSDTFHGPQLHQSQAIENVARVAASATTIQTQSLLFYIFILQIFKIWILATALLNSLVETVLYALIPYLPTPIEQRDYFARNVYVYFWIPLAMPKMFCLLLANMLYGKYISC